MSYPRVVEQDVLAYQKKDFLDLFTLQEHIRSFRISFLRAGKAKEQNYVIIIGADYSDTAPYEFTGSGGSIMIKIHGDEEAHRFVLAMIKKVRDFGFFVPVPYEEKVEKTLNKIQKSKAKKGSRE